jgi:hypothetical protein
MLTSAVPRFLVRDIQASAPWHRDGLGFGFDRFWGAPPVFVILWRDAVEINAQGVPPRACGRTAEMLRREPSQRGAAIRRGPERLTHDCVEIEVGYAPCFGATDPIGVCPCRCAG